MFELSFISFCCQTHVMGYTSNEWLFVVWEVIIADITFNITYINIWKEDNILSVNIGCANKRETLFVFCSNVYPKSSKK